MRNEKRTRLQVDGYTRACLTAISVLLTLLVIGLWADRPGVGVLMGAADDPPRGGEGLKAVQEGRWGSSSAPQQAMVKAQQETTAKLDELIRLLKSGDVKVQTVQATGGADATRPAAK